MEEKVIAIEELIKNNMSIVTSIQELSEDERKELLRKSDFINKLNSFQLEDIINSLNFMDAFNMLQNTKLLDKIQHVNVKLKAKDAMFVKDFIDLIPSMKIHPDMIYNMLKTLPKDDVIRYLSDHIIYDNLSDNHLIDLSVLKKINLFEIFKDIEVFNEDTTYKYVDQYFRATLDYNIIDNMTAKKIIFKDENINLDETRYLYDYLTTQNNHSCKDIKHSLKAFIKVNDLYNKYGLNDTIKMFNTKGITIDDCILF